MVAKPDHIEFADGTTIPILYEDRAVLVIDKPAGWMLAPDSWNRTSRNLQRTLERSVKAGDWWARSRQLKFIRYVHRLDAGTTGILLLVKSPGAIHPYSRLFVGRHVEKRYLAVVRGVPAQTTWTCELPVARHRRLRGVMKVDLREGKPAETRFRVLEAGPDRSLIEAQPLTGRTHQIRLHLAAAGYPILGDELYSTRPHLVQPKAAGKGSTPPSRNQQSILAQPARTRLDVPVASAATPSDTVPALALRAVFLAYTDPFTGKKVQILAPFDAFVRAYGFKPESVPVLEWGLTQSERASACA
jgi:RluA family pseudouridine synthase